MVRRRPGLWRSSRRWPKPGSSSTLFNLLPILPLDGGRTAAALHSGFWAAGLGGRLVLMVFRPSPIIPIIVFLGGRELWQRWKGRDTDESRRYNAIAPTQRIAVAVAYLGLMGLLVLGHERDVRAPGLLSPTAAG